VQPAALEIALDKHRLGPRTVQFVRKPVNASIPSTLPTMMRLGPLERQMLEAVWARGDGTVRELLNHQKLRMAYTTAMTTLTRLYEKQVLTRTVEGRAFRYKARFTKVEMQRAEAEQLIRQLLRSATTVALPLSYLVEAVTEHDVRLLDDLQRLVEQKQRQLGKGE